MYDHIYIMCTFIFEVYLPHMREKYVEKILLKIVYSHFITYSLI
jgi:hypothetical protein